MGDQDNPAPKDSWHRHQYWDYNKNRWVSARCNCATGKDHKTPKNR